MNPSSFGVSLLVVQCSGVQLFVRVSIVRTSASVYKPWCHGESRWPLRKRRVVPALVEEKILLSVGLYLPRSSDTAFAVKGSPAPANKVAVEVRHLASYIAYKGQSAHQT